MNCCFNGEWQQTVLKLLSNLKTRDALYRVMQFSLRVVLAVRGIAAANRRSASIFARLMSGAGVSPVDAKLQTTVSALATGRKVLGFGNIISELPNFYRLAKRLCSFNLALFMYACAYHSCGKMCCVFVMWDDVSVEYEMVFSLS